MKRKTLINKGWFKVVESGNVLTLLEVDLTSACCGENRREWKKVADFTLSELAEILGKNEFTRN